MSNLDNEKVGPEYQWTKDESGRTVNEALGIWFILRSNRIGSEGVFLPIGEPHDGKALAKFNVDSESRELNDDEKSDNPGVDYEITFKINAANSYDFLPEGIDQYNLIRQAVIAFRGVPTLYRMAEDKNYYAIVRVDFVSTLPPSPY